MPKYDTIHLIQLRGRTFLGTKMDMNVKVPKTVKVLTVFTVFTLNALFGATALKRAFAARNNSIRNGRRPYETRTSLNAKVVAFIATEVALLRSLSKATIFVLWETDSFTCLNESLSEHPTFYLNLWVLCGVSIHRFFRCLKVCQRSYWSTAMPIAATIILVTTYVSFTTSYVQMYGFDNTTKTCRLYFDIERAKTLSMHEENVSESILVEQTDRTEHLRLIVVRTTITWLGVIFGLESIAVIIFSYLTVRLLKLHNKTITGNVMELKAVGTQENQVQQEEQVEQEDKVEEDQLEQEDPVEEEDEVEEEDPVEREYDPLSDLLKLDTAAWIKSAYKELGCFFICIVCYAPWSVLEVINIYNEGEMKFPDALVFCFLVFKPMAITLTAIVSIYF